MDVRLDGRKALITGGSAGLGKAMAKKFAESGAEVAILARRAGVLEQARGEVASVTNGRVMAYVCDVTDAEALQNTYRRAESDLGPIDILVNNAGTSQTGKFVEISDEVWRADLELKLFAAIRLARLAFPGMCERRWGRIINILNIGAKAPRGASAPTSVSRAAGMALTKVLANEGAPHNVLVNALLVGLIDSDQHVRRYEAGPGGKSYEQFIADMAQARGVPMGRMGTAEEFANVACFLASDAGGYVTGTALNVDGGNSPVV